MVINLIRDCSIYQGPCHVTSEACFGLFILANHETWLTQPTRHEMNRLASVYRDRFGDYYTSAMWFTALEECEPCCSWTVSMSVSLSWMTIIGNDLTWVWQDQFSPLFCTYFRFAKIPFTCLILHPYDRYKVWVMESYSTIFKISHNSLAEVPLRFLVSKLMDAADQWTWEVSSIECSEQRVKKQAF